MSERPWYRRYPSDFLHGTAGMSLEAKGAYSIVLDLIYDRRGAIPDDPRWIAGHCGCSVRLWNRIRADLIEAGKLLVEGGFITNPRAVREMDIAQETARKLAENGAKGGNKSAVIRGNRPEKLTNSSEVNDLAEATLPVGLKHRARVLYPDTRNNPVVPTAKSQIEVAFAEFKSAYPNRDGSQDWVKAEARFAGLVKNGTDPAALIAAATAYRAEATRKGNLGSSYVKQAATFLSGTWKEYGPSSQPASAKPTSLPADWPNGIPTPDRVRDAWSRGQWPGQWGPRPGETGCRLSASALAIIGADAPQRRGEVAA